MPRLRRPGGLRTTRAGRALLLLAVPAWLLALALHWTELLVVALTSTVLLAVCLVLALLPRPATARVEARPWRTAVGSPTRVDLHVTARRWPVVVPLVRLEGEVLPQVLRLPTLWPGRERGVVLEDVARRRGVFEVGPVVHLASDPLGLFRRESWWSAAGTLWVRPRVQVPSTSAAGAVFDLEGAPSDQASTSDLAFHALREYVPGDDLRRVHWRSSAKADSLLVRQYVESRTSHAAFLLDDDPGSYADPEEFELAVSATASLALRALADGFEVDLVCGDRASAPAGPGTLLDECCHLGLAPAPHTGHDEGLVGRAGVLARRRPLVGVAVVVTGSRCDEELLFEAAGVFGSARRLAVRAELGREEPGLRLVHGVRTLAIGDLPHLGALALVGAR